MQLETRKYPNMDQPESNVYKFCVIRQRIDCFPKGAKGRNIEFVQFRKKNKNGKIRIVEMK